MKQPRLGICYYPTTIGLIDDNKEYLKHLLARLAMEERLPCVTYDDPKKALQYLTQEYKADPFINRCLTSQDNNEYDHLVVDFDIRAIHQEIQNPNRSNELTVLVIDYAMPSINGLDICRQLRNTAVKIIMLTGEAGKDFAVNVFNEGSIDKFILKDTPDIMDVLVQTIHELQLKYFLDLSKMALNKIADFSNQILRCLEDAAFVKFFQQLCETHHIVEYYLMDTHGSFLLLDAQGQPSWLAVADEELMSSYAQLAELDDAAPTMVAAIKNKQSIPYFYTEADFSVRPAEWQRYLHPAKMLQGKQNYYYAHITDPKAYDINRDKIVSYQKILAARGLA